MEAGTSRSRQEGVHDGENFRSETYSEVHWYTPRNDEFPYREVYQTLDRDLREIRLVRLLPGRCGSTLKCEFINHFSLHHLSRRQSGSQTPTKCTYKALSYCAGKPSDSLPIELNGNLFNVFASLHAALQQLRHSQTEQIMWIDQVCINQTDTSERNHQVLQMKDIYKNASAVPIWLGPEDEYSSLAISVFREIFNRHANSMQASGELTTPVKWIADRINDPTWSDKWMSAANFLHRPWWNRTWVVQEVVLSTQPYILCGLEQIDWEQFVVAVRLLNTTAQQTRIPWSSEYRGQILLFAELYTSRFSNVFAIPSIVTKMDRRLSSLLDSTRRLSVSDARDKVYSMLGLLEEGIHEQYEIMPDYVPSNTSEDVFLHAAKASISVENSLEILRNAFSDDRSSNLPSWVPNWDLWRTYFRVPSDFSASGQYLPSTRFLEDGVLEVKTILLDKISNRNLGAANSCNPLESEQVTLIINSWKEIMIRACETRYREGESSLVAFYRTMHLDQGDAQQYQDGRSGLSTMQLENALLDSIEHFIGNKTAGGRFFVSEGLHMGLAPKQVQDGDKIFILLGATVPFILRREGEYYRLIGEAYVHGVMYGEIADEYSDGKRIAETLYLR